MARDLERTGKIVTATADILSVIFVAFITSQVAAFIKLNRCRHGSGGPSRRTRARRGEGDRLRTCKACVRAAK